MNASNIYIAYAIEDDLLKDRLEEHLSQLKRDGLLQYIWSMETVSAGSNQWQKHKEFLQKADMVLLLISSDFIGSSNYDTELSLILPQVKQRNLPVIPIILRPCLWESDTLQSFKPFPEDGSSIVGSSQMSEDQYFSLIAKEIRNLLLSKQQKAALSSQTLPNKSKMTSYIGIFSVFLIVLSSGLYFTCQRKSLPPDSDTTIARVVSDTIPKTTTPLNDTTTFRGKAVAALFKQFSEALLLDDLEEVHEVVAPLFHPSFLDENGRLDENNEMRYIKSLHKIAHNDVYIIPFRIVEQRPPVPNKSSSLEDEFGEGEFVTYFLAKKDPKNRPFPIILFFGVEDSLPKIKQLSF